MPFYIPVVQTWREEPAIATQKCKVASNFRIRIFVLISTLSSGAEAEAPWWPCQRPGSLPRAARCPAAGWRGDSVPIVLLRLRETVPAHTRSTAEIQPLHFSRFATLSSPKKPILSGIEKKGNFSYRPAFLGLIFTCHSDTVCVIIFINFRREGNENSMVEILKLCNVHLA